MLMLRAGLALMCAVGLPAFAVTADGVKRLETYPPAIHLKSGDESSQLIVTAVAADGSVRDVTRSSVYASADPNIAGVTATGRVLPFRSGQTAINVSFGEHSVRVPITATAIEETLPSNFANHVVPIFSKLGCNSGGCHGKSGGQNGFALSLFGFIPEFDYPAVVSESRGRRIFPANPDFSLLLRKATGQVAHAGGKRMDVASEEYKLVRRWIAAGTPFGQPGDPVLSRITIYPEQRIVPRGESQQMAVHAHYSDGRIVDVTQRAVYESNDTEIATVDGAALVRSLGICGEAAIMARYQDQVATFRITVPSGLKTPAYDFPQQTIVDRFTHKKWQDLGITPSQLCSDEILIRRVSLDLTGTMPTPEQVVAFTSDRDPNRRAKLVDRLLDSAEYSYFFANRWADVLRVRRGNNPQTFRAPGTFAFHSWIRESIAQDKPYDRFAAEILGAIGDEVTWPPTVWFKDLQKPEHIVDDACQVFLGVRMNCAQCHHHPYEKWSQDDYWGMAAFFGHVARKNTPIRSLVVNNQPQVRQVIFNRADTTVNPRTKKAAVLKVLDGPALAIERSENPRPYLIDWIVHKDNPFFARAVANRYWAHFFGRGLVDPLDDMRITNPPSNPELLDALAQHLIDNEYSLKQLIRAIVNSRTYQLSVFPNEFNKADKRNHARFHARRMRAEVLYDAVSQLTGVPASFPGMPADRHAPNRAIMLPDEAFESYFLDVFSRPQRISACECERVTEANVAQSLHLLNSKEVHDKLSRPGGRADQLARDPRPDADKVTELFLHAFARRPTMEQLHFALRKIDERGSDKRSAYEDIIWALMNSKEFILIQ